MPHHDAAQFAILFCEPHNFEFYRSQGWHRFTGTVYAEQPGGKIRFEAMAPFVLDLKRRAPTLGTPALCGLPWCRIGAEFFYCYAPPPFFRRVRCLAELNSSSRS